MPSRSARLFTTLIRKEARELIVSRAFALLLVLVSLLVGHAYITAVETYAELSGAAGGAAALAQGMNPLDGIFVPTFGAYDLAATLLLPFVVIRLFAAERDSGAWTILVQSPATVRFMVAVKAIALALAWMLAMLPGLAAVALWKSQGGHVDGAELGALLLGHLLRAGLTIGLAAAAAAATLQSASAAIVTLGVTVGSWALDFVAAVRGGILERVAAFTPTAALRLFEHGLVNASAVTVMTVTCVAGLAIAVVWLAPAASTRAKIAQSAFVALAFMALAAAGERLRSSWDVSEDRRNSFAATDEAALRSLDGRLRIEAHLAPEDPRLADLQRDVLAKLVRVVPRLVVVRTSQTRTGLFAGRDEHYGEIWYDLRGNRAMQRSTIEAVVLETIFTLAGIAAPPHSAATSYAGYPLVAKTTLAAPLFYVVWPALIVALLLVARRKRSG